MPHLRGTHGQFTYITEGEGFPLLLVPADSGSIRDWSAQAPLLGELCRVVAYEYRPPSTSSANAVRVQSLASLLDALRIERTYLAGYASGGLTALHFARRYPERTEGLLLIGIDADLSAVPLYEIAVPTCVFAGSAASTHVACATLLASQLPRCAKIVIPDASAAPHREQPLPLGQAMMTFLMQCERQRNLVRGASFLL
jgi:pimeloyl-ACP methyl ester carboxylesterase